MIRLTTIVLGKLRFYKRDIDSNPDLYLENSNTPPVLLTLEVA